MLRRTRLLVFVLVGSALALLAGILYVRGVRRRPEPPPSKPPDPLSSEECASLASRYAAAWEDQNHCASDADCVATPRSGRLVGLDRCARYGPPSADPRAADALATAWLAGACAHDFDACARLPEAACHLGRCADRPPPPLPASWQRTEVERTFALFLPPGMVELKVPGEDSLVRVWRSERLGVSFDYGSYSNPLDSLSQGHRLISMEETVVGGRPAKIRITTIDAADTRSRKDAETHIGVHFALIQGAPHSYHGGGLLTVFVHCQGAPPCPDGERIARSIAFYTTNAVKP
ncbi:MAG: hypothetical protein ABJE95_01590 [Byssovorax sp.]